MARRLAWRTLPRLVRIGLWSLAGLVALVIAGGAVVALSFDPDSLKPRVIAAVKQATGRDLTLQGRIRLGLSLQPTLTVQGVAFANPPGFSRPQMATLEQLDLKLALIPLLSHRVEIDRLVLVKPDIILETDAQGRPNWQFTPASSPPAPQSTAAGSQDGAATNISVADVRVENGTITWRDGRTGRSAVLGLTSLRASAPSPDANLDLSMSANYNGTPFTLAGEFGPLTRLQDRQASAAWPVQAHLEAVGAKLTVDGTVAQPMEGRGYRLKLTANVPDVAALAPFVPGTRPAATTRCQPGGAGRRYRCGAAGAIRPDAACRPIRPDRQGGGIKARKTRHHCRCGSISRCRSPPKPASTIRPRR